MGGPTLSPFPNRWFASPEHPKHRLVDGAPSASLLGIYPTCDNNLALTSYDDPGMRSDFSLACLPQLRTRTVERLTW